MDEPDEIPSWFKGKRPDAPDPAMHRTCEKCGAPPGEQCRYMSSTNLRKDPGTGEVVKVPLGHKMARPHRAR